MPYIPPPDTPLAFPFLLLTKRKTRFGGGLRKRWKDTDGNLYEWDYLHGTLEKYSPQGRHMGEFNPDTGDLIAPADRGRTIEP